MIVLAVVAINCAAMPRPAITSHRQQNNCATESNVVSSIKLL